MKNVLGVIRITSEGDAASDYASGSNYVPMFASWNSTGGIQTGDIDTGSDTALRIQRQEETDRACFAIRCSGVFFKRGIDPDFSHAGGSPALPVDLSEYARPPSSSDVTDGIYVSRLWVTTDAWEFPYAVVSSPALGKWFFVEGEDEDRYQIWDPED